jgi:hypothetical protein
MIVVLDANVLVSGLLSPKGAPGQIIEAWREERFLMAVSPPILEEIRRVFRYPRIRQRLREEEVQRLMDDLAQVARVTPGQLMLNVLTVDPSDNLYLACAVEANADYLVTGNKRHFATVGDEYQGIRIVTPRVFLTLLRGEYFKQG